MRYNKHRDCVHPDDDLGMLGCGVLYHTRDNDKTQKDQVANAYTQPHKLSMICVATLNSYIQDTQYGHDRKQQGEDGRLSSGQ